jgi:hypothetical protein
MPLQPIIAWDYLFAPNAQKSRLYLYLTKTPFSICEQPFVLPRPDLTVFARKDFAGLQNSARSEFRAFLEGAEGGFLKDGEGPFVGGEQEVGMADVHAVWMVKWVRGVFAKCSRGEGVADVFCSMSRVCFLDLAGGLNGTLGRGGRDELRMMPQATRLSIAHELTISAGGSRRSI